MNYFSCKKNNTNNGQIFNLISTVFVDLYSTSSESSKRRLPDKSKFKPYFKQRVFNAFTNI